MPQKRIFCLELLFLFVDFGQLFLHLCYFLLQSPIYGPVSLINAVLLRVDFLVEFQNIILNNLSVPVCGLQLGDLLPRVRNHLLGFFDSIDLRYDVLKFLIPLFLDVQMGIETIPQFG